MTANTHNALIYHCLRCGNVVHREPEAEAPWCCGGEMAKAAAETICEPECACEEAEPPQTHIRRTAAPVMKVPRKG